MVHFKTTLTIKISTFPVSLISTLNSKCKTDAKCLLCRVEPASRAVPGGTLNEVSDSEDDVVEAASSEE